MKPINITVVNQDYRPIFNQTITNPTKIKTRWIQGEINKPTVAIFESGGEQKTINLEYKATEKGKKVEMGVDTLFNYHVKVIFSYGVDDTRPSWAGTISFNPVKEKRE